jgi:polysaccharide biosynthesis transport protein
MDAEQTVGMADYLAALQRRRILMAGLGLPVFVLVTLVALALPSIYKSTAVFRLRDAGSDQNRQRYADKYIKGLTDYVMKVPKPDNIAQQLRGQDVHVEMITESILDPDSGHNKEINTGFAVAYDDRDPKTAQQVAAWLADTFLKGSRTDALVAASSQVKFYADEADRARVQIADLEGKVADFKKQNFEQLPDEAPANLNVKNQTEQELAGIEREITTQHQNRIFLMQQLETAKANGGAGANLAQLEDEYKRKKAIYDESHPDMIALRRQIEAAKLGDARNADGSLKSELDAQKAILAETRMRYSDDHPDVRRLMSSIKSLEARIAAGEKTDPDAVTGNTPVVVQLNTQIHAADTQIASLQARRAELQEKSQDMDRRLAATPAVERQYEILDRDLGTARTQYQGLLNQRLDAEVRAQAIVAGTADPFVLVQPPAESGVPDRPRRGSIVVLGFLGATVLAFVGAIIAEVLDGSVRGSRDVVNLLATAPLATIPEIRNGAFHRRRRMQLVAVAFCTVVGTPLLYFVIVLMVR